MYGYCLAFVRNGREELEGNMVGGGNMHEKMQSGGKIVEREEREGMMRRCDFYSLFYLCLFNSKRPNKSINRKTGIR